MNYVEGKKVTLMQEITVVFPNQLFAQSPALNKKRTVYLVEENRYFTDFKFHKQKLILHRASMQNYLHTLQKKGLKVVYVEYHQSHKLFTLLKQAKISSVHYVDVIDTKLQKQIANQAKKMNIECVIYESPSFLSPIEWLTEQFSGKKHYLMNSFYIAQRKRMNILVKNGKPIGGSWSFDKENRQPMPAHINIPPLPTQKQSSYVKEAIQYVQTNFGQNPGSIEHFIYPTNHTQAQLFLQDFLQHRLKYFGTYQDAILKDETFLFHSVLTPALNTGLLTPKEVVDAALQYSEKHVIPLNCLEGFLRQIIGWREFVRGVYTHAGEKQRNMNFFKHTNKLPASFWQSNTTLEPVDNAIQRVIQHAYTHHIERLMVLGNCMLLCQIEPNEVYAWFMELFIDAYDWVMVPNVYGMSQYADGGLMATKPYIAGSNYIAKMSDYKKGNYTSILNALYWNFIYKHQKIIKKNPRLAIMLSYLKKMEKATLKQHLTIAQTFLNKQKTAL